MSRCEVAPETVAVFVREVGCLGCTRPTVPPVAGLEVDVMELSEHVVIQAVPLAVGQDRPRFEGRRPSGPLVSFEPEAEDCVLVCVGDLEWPRMPVACYLGQSPNLVRSPHNRDDE